VTFQPGKYDTAAFSFDGQRIAYCRYPYLDILAKSSTGNDAEQSLLHSDEYKWPNDWSPDGRFILYSSQTKGNAELWLLPVTGSQKPAPFLQTPFFTVNGSFSPDGKWIAYTSNESGRNEVYVRPVSGARQWQVSTSGGDWALWRTDGKELYYWFNDFKVMAVDVKEGPELEFGTPHAIFDGPRNAQDCWLTPDGQRILCNIPVNDSGPASAPISLVVNWPAGLH
jgi:Tol biopolymer transport system component